MIARIVLLVAACLLLAGSPPAELPASPDETAQVDANDVAVVPEVTTIAVISHHVAPVPVADPGSAGRLHPLSVFRPPRTV